MTRCAASRSLLSPYPRMAHQRGTGRPCLDVPVVVVSINNAPTSPDGESRSQDVTLNVIAGALRQFPYSQACGKPRRYWPLSAWQRLWQRSEAL